MNEEKLSKYLSYLLRHHPEEADLHMDENGWVDVAELLHHTDGKFSMARLTKIVDIDKKKRYSFNTNKTKIRANQGHSLDVNPDLKKETPPDILYHGTAERFFNSIMQVGITHQTRRFVHLSKDYDTALKVGLRHGDAIVLELDTKKMAEDGIDFYISENDVWMTEFVDPKYIIILGDYLTVTKKIDKSKYTNASAKIWIDDVRPMPEGYDYHAYSVNTAIMMLESAKEGGEKIKLIDLDHDAGDYAVDGGDYIKILDYCESQKEWIDKMKTKFRIHSMNPVGRQNMQRIIEKNGWTLID